MNSIGSTPANYQIDDFSDPFIISHPISDAHFRGNFHIHNDYFEFYLFLNSKAICYNDGEKYILYPGDFLIISPNKIHRVYTTDSVPYERVVLHLSKETLIDISSPLTNLYHDILACSNRLYHFEISELTDYIELAKHLENISAPQIRVHGKDLLQRSYLSILLVRMLEKLRDTSNEVGVVLPPIIRETSDYISAHLSDDISIQSIADALNISRSYLCHQFKDYFNTSLWNYILSRRLVLAQKLLLEGRSVTEACYESGFRDYAHFIKTFSKTFGVSPKKYSMNPVGQKTITLPS